MHRCKACGSPVCDSKERRVLDKSTSESVRLSLCDFTKDHLGDDSVSFSDERFSDGYLCKKCFMLVQKRSRLRRELENIDATILSNIKSAASVFAFDEEQGSIEVVRASKRYRTQQLQGSSLTTSSLSLLLCF